MLGAVKGILLIALLALLVADSIVVGKWAEQLERTVELQDARIKQLEQSELQMRGWFQPPDTVFVERKGEGI